jgi:hypothetical protein
MTLDHAHRVDDLDFSAGSWRQICNVLTIKLHGGCDIRSLDGPPVGKREGYKGKANRPCGY